MEGVVPLNLKEALSLMAQKKYIPIAGGTDLMVRYKRWKNLVPRFPKTPLFLSHINELKGIYKSGEYVVIKAATSLSEIEYSEIVPDILREAVKKMAAPGIRNMGTIGGNIGNASPAGDTLPSLYVLDADVILLSESERRCVKIYDFIRGPGKNDLKEDEIIYEIRFKIPKYTHFLYRKVGTRKANALSKLSFIGIAKVENNEISDFRVAFGAVAPTPVRSIEIEEKVIGTNVTKVNKAFIEDIKGAYGLLIRPIDDQRSTAAYRRSVSLRLLETFLKSLK